MCASPLARLDGTGDVTRPHSVGCGAVPRTSADEQAVRLETAANVWLCRCDGDSSQRVRSTGEDRDAHDQRPTIIPLMAILRMCPINHSLPGYFFIVRICAPTSRIACATPPPAVAINSRCATILPRCSSISPRRPSAVRHDSVGCRRICRLYLYRSIPRDCRWPRRRAGWLCALLLGRISLCRPVPGRHDQRQDRRAPRDLDRPAADGHLVREPFDNSGLCPTFGRVAARPGGGGCLGHRVGLLPAAASTPNRHRRAEERADHPLPQQLLPVSRIRRPWVP